MHHPIESWLFDTDAVRVCPEGAPFWYTSGKLGPFYINTHFLYGGEEAANALLARIEEEAAQRPLDLPRVIGRLTDAQALADERYGLLMGQLTELARGLSFDFVSGGERRDFFFSLGVARALGKPHLTIFKDLTCVYTDASGATVPAAAADLHGQRALHIADLVTEASSYTRAWIPAVEAQGARIVESIAVIDRDQGGRETLAKAGIPLHTLVKIDATLFDRAVATGKLAPAQRDMAQSFLLDPSGFMREFFQAHPMYLAQQIALGGKARERAERCIAQGFDKL